MALRPKGWVRVFSNAARSEISLPEGFTFSVAGAEPGESMGPSPKADGQLASTKHSANTLFIIGAVYVLIAFEHYYLDGLIWSFRRPHVRETMLPFLLRRPPRVSS